MRTKELLQNPFIRKWISLNLLGWFLGLVLGPLLFLIILPASTLDFPSILIGTLQPLFSSFLFGVGLGSMQQIILRHWNVPPGLWILATAFGIAIPTTLISWLLDSGLLGYDLWAFLASVAQLLLMGCGIGGLQAIMIRKTISKISSWVWAHVVGFLVLGIAGIVIAAVALLGAEPIQEFFYSLDLWQLVEYRDVLLLLSIGIVLPFLAALFIGLPTGKILHRVGNVATEGNDDGTPKTKLAIS